MMPPLVMEDDVGLVDGFEITLAAIRLLASPENSRVRDECWTMNWKQQPVWEALW